MMHFPMKTDGCWYERPDKGCLLCRIRAFTKLAKRARLWKDLEKKDKLRVVNGCIAIDTDELTREELRLLLGL